MWHREKIFIIRVKLFIISFLSFQATQWMFSVLISLVMKLNTNVIIVCHLDTFLGVKH